jgi:hypothetical protein
LIFKVDEANLHRIAGQVQEISAGKWEIPTNGGKNPVKNTKRSNGGRPGDGFIQG